MPMTVDAELQSTAGGCRDGHTQPPFQWPLSGCPPAGPTSCIVGALFYLDLQQPVKAPDPSPVTNGHRGGGGDSSLWPCSCVAEGGSAPPPQPGPLTVPACLLPDSILRGTVTGLSVPGTQALPHHGSDRGHQNMRLGEQTPCCPLVSSGSTQVGPPSGGGPAPGSTPSQAP